MTIETVTVDGTDIVVSTEPLVELVDATSSSDVIETPALTSTQIVTAEGIETVITEDITTEIVEVAVQGPVGPAGPAGVPSASIYTAAENISGHQAVVLNVDGAVIVASAETPTHQAVLGISANAASTGGNVQVIDKGFIEHLGWTFTSGLPVFLGVAGALTQTFAPTAVFSKVLGIALSPTRISVDFQPAIFI